MTGSDIDDDDQLVDRIEALAERLQRRGRQEQDEDLTAAGGLLDLMAEVYALQRSRDGSKRPAGANDNTARNMLH